jgi:hypothetical protein
MISNSVITCPKCGYQAAEEMPTDACQKRALDAPAQLVDTLAEAERLFPVAAMRTPPPSWMPSTSTHSGAQSPPFVTATSTATTRRNARQRGSRSTTRRCIPSIHALTASLALRLQARSKLCWAGTVAQCPGVASLTPCEHRRAYGLARLQVSMRLCGVFQRIGLVDLDLDRA